MAEAMQVFFKSILFSCFFLVALHSKYTLALTFENLCQRGDGSAQCAYAGDVSGDVSDAERLGMRWADVCLC